MKKLATTLLLGSLSFGQAQQTELVFVFFKDKPNKAAFYANPLGELSEKSLERRVQKSIPLNDQDVPIEASYIQNIKNLGYSIIDSSKWLNGIAVNATTSEIQTLKTLSYISHVESFVKNRTGTKKTTQMQSNRWKATSSFTDFNYGDASSQIEQINLKPLHLAGYTGSGITIAVIDTGFPTVDNGEGFKRLRDNNQIKGGYNFVTKTNNIFDSNLNIHGTLCLATIGGYLTNSYEGSAPDANFYLYVSENTEEEIPEEELYWIEAAEEADRKGVDLITTSLGYNQFDDSRYDYTYADMNGNTSFIARGAQIASEKGIFVSFAAGNEGDKYWHYIVTPADNPNVFTVGAVDASGASAVFTSFGPNASGIIKPDVSARGVATATIFDGTVVHSNGTSFANPLTAGAIASLLQALPKSIPLDDLKNRLRQQASLASSPNTQQGYGIINLYKTYQNFLLVNESNKENFQFFPNPATQRIEIQSKEKITSVEIYDNIGRLIIASSSSKIDISKLDKGIYYVNINKGSKVEKLIKN